MWNYLLLVALVQGVTEFLPISSSAHLILLPGLMGQHDQGLTIDVAAHLGSLFAVVAYFRRDVGAVIHSVLTLRWSEGLLMPLIIATAPIVLAGLLLSQIVATELRSTWVIAGTTIVFGLILWWADRAPSTRQLDAITPGHALAIGVAQVFALIPGTSRSGVTMSAARLLCYDRSESARFSMLLGIPAILAASALMGWEIQRGGDWSLGIESIGVALASFVVAWLSIAGLMRWLRHASFTPFVIYRLLLGALLIAWLALK